MSETPDATTSEQAAASLNLLKDWQGVNRVLAGLMSDAGLSRAEALQYLMVRELAIVRDAIEQRGVNGMRYHPDCKACQQEKHFHELQLAMMEQQLKETQDEHGDGWKDV